MSPDIVYILKDINENIELKYSIRSVEENFKGHRIVFVGGSPRGLKPDIQIRTTQNNGKWDNAHNNIVSACEDDRLTEEIYLFNDDFFVLRKTDELPVYTNGELGEFIAMVEKRTGETEFIKRLKRALKLLNENNLPTQNYEVHVPMRINRHKMSELLKKFPEAVAVRSIYGNYFGVPGVEVDKTGKMQDGVQQNSRRGLKKDRLLVSSTDESFKGVVGYELKRMFNRPSKYERTR